MTRAHVWMCAGWGGGGGGGGGQWGGGGGGGEDRWLESAIYFIPRA